MGTFGQLVPLQQKKLQIRCVMETHVVTIRPPLQTVDIGNGCEAYSASIYIPAKFRINCHIAINYQIPILS